MELAKEHPFIRALPFCPAVLRGDEAVAKLTTFLLNAGCEHEYIMPMNREQTDYLNDQELLKILLLATGVH